MERKRVKLSEILALLEPEDHVFIMHRLAPLECEAVAGGTVAEVIAARCVEVCGDNIVERLKPGADDWPPDTVGPVLLITIGGKEAQP